MLGGRNSTGHESLPPLEDTALGHLQPRLPAVLLGMGTLAWPSHPQVPGVSPWWMDHPTARTNIPLPRSVIA